MTNELYFVFLFLTDGELEQLLVGSKGLNIWVSFSLIDKLQGAVWKEHSRGCSSMGTENATYQENKPHYRTSKNLQ